MSWMVRIGALVILAALASGGCSASDKLLGSDGSTVKSEPTGGGPAVSLPPPAAVGEPCITRDEWSPYFSGFGVHEVNIEDGGTQCESTICLVNHFQGRVSCPYGQAQGASDCLLPDGSSAVAGAVAPQLVSRPANVTSICSCRCDGADPGPYCTCPESMQCQHLVEDLHLNDEHLAGSYCIPKGTQYDSSMPNGPVCVEPNCGPTHPM